MSPNNPDSVTIFTIATGKYWVYFLQLLECFGKFPLENSINFLVLTDEDLDTKRNRLRNKNVRIEKAKFTTWPEVTLMRYSEILRFSSLINTSKVIWIDVDMYLTKMPPITTLFSELRFARHPGFEFSTRTFSLRTMPDQVNKFLSFCYRLSKGQRYLGAWEENLASGAFVPRTRRGRYVHGAFWGGPKEEVVRMCRILDARVRADLSVGHIPVWHDESYLNWYRSEFKIKYLPKYSSATEELKQSQVLQSLVLSIHKEKYEKNNFLKFTSYS